MDIVNYEPSLAGDMCALYNQTIEPVMHCYPMNLNRFLEALEPTQHAQHKGPKNMRVQKSFVAMEGKSIVGYAHAGILVNGEEQVESIGIRFLTYQPGKRAAGLLLLDRIEAWAKDEGVTIIFAFHQRYRLPFYHYVDAYLSDRISHVQALFASRGYEKFNGSVFLNYDTFEPRDLDPIDLAVEITSEERSEQGKLPGLTHWAWIDGKKVGECITVSSEVDLKSPDVEDSVIVDVLNVYELWQGKGIGKYLLQRALNDAYAIGYRQVVISTAWNNHRAFLFYSNFGFSVSDWTYGWKQSI